jgi:hypothetical protein
MHLFIFISPWYDQASIFGHWQDVLCELWQFHSMFSCSLNFEQLHDHYCHDIQSTVSLKSCGDYMKRVTHFLGGINTLLIL